MIICEWFNYCQKYYKSVGNDVMVNVLLTLHFEKILISVIGVNKTSERCIFVTDMFIVNWYFKLRNV